LFWWGEKQQAAFDQLNIVLTSPPVLRIADPDRPYEVITDASVIAIGAVLLQDFGEGLQPVAYESRKLHGAEKKYTVHGKEMLAIVHAFKTWRCYLTGADVTVRTDHKSLQYLRAQPNLNPQQIRWLDFLQSNVHYTITYKRGANDIADALTRPTAHTAAILRPWQHVTMDYVTGLPARPSGNDAILVIVDQLTKMAHFIACQQKITAEQTAQLFITNLEEAGTPTPDIEDFPPQMKVLVDEFKEVFGSIPDGLPPDRAVGHTIPVEPGKLPPFRPLYRLSPAEYEEAKQRIEEYLKKGWIEPSASLHGAPILFVNKKGGGLRMCVDYRALNKITIKNRYHLPRIEDLFDRLHGAQWFSALDLAQGYHQLRITEEDVPKTALRSPFGHFQWRVLSFGLTNAPASFQRAMNDVFREAIGHFVLVYLDNILVYSKTENEHTQHLKWVLGKLREHKFYARLWKCHFYKHELEYLGHLVGNNGLKVDPKNVVAVQNWPVPQDVCQIRSFLGLANYFRRFLENYSTVVAPLTALTRKGSAWEWTRQCQEAFDKVKTKLTNGPVLVLPDPSKPYEVVTDASTVGIGAVLLQEGRPVAFESRKVSPAEQRYTTSKQELLAVVHALRTWRCYLEGVEFVVTTDHCPNTYFSTQATLTRRQARWAELLSGFTFDIRYRAGSTNMADPLSRQPIGAATGLDETEDKAVVAACFDVSAEDTAKLFVAHVFRLHGLPRVLVSDRDPRFTSRFWHEVTRTLRTKLKMSSAFHPQTDGQTERTNHTLEQMLRSFIGPTQDDWDDLLHVVEFAENNSVHEGTHEKPFILNCGRHPTTPTTHGICGLRVPAAKDFVGKQLEALKSAHRWLQLSQQRQKSYADMKRREVSFEVGDKVLLSTKNIRLKIPGAKKSFPQWIGPFEMIQRVGVVAYKLKLPETLQIHNVFHVSLLNK
ncbi:hypothetical protein CLOP_g19847, partial [Closterium sp. NIES-67]